MTDILNNLLITGGLLVALMALYAGATYLWNYKYVPHALTKGKLKKPLGTIFKEVQNYTFKEDTGTLAKKASPKVQKLLSHKAIHIGSILLGIIGFILTGNWYFLLLLPLSFIVGFSRALPVTKRRTEVLDRIFQIASSSMKFTAGPRAKNAAPPASWNHLQVEKWNKDTPMKMVITFPSGNGPEQNAQKTFEKSFELNVTDENIWNFEWDLPHDRVTIEAAPHLPTQLPYPGSRDSKWSVFPVGESSAGLASYDVSVFPHALCAGPSGSGKSVLQRNIVFHTIQHNDRWRFLGVDLKRVELTPYNKYKKTVMGIATDVEQGLAVLKYAYNEMMDRYKEMERIGVNNVMDMADPPYCILLMIDEATMFLGASGSKTEEGKAEDAMKGEASDLVGKILRLGRASGIHMLVAMQRPDATVLRGEFKHLALDTRIPTPDGWTTMGEIQVGDQVFDEKGNITNVLFTSDVTKQKAFKITFDSGEIIVASDSHHWIAWGKKDKYARREALKKGKETPIPSLRTTEELFNTFNLKGEKQYSIPVAGEIKPPEKDLPIDPYVLGVWLGDGSTGSVNFTTVDVEIIKTIENRGYHVTPLQSRNSDFYSISETIEKANRWHPGFRGNLREAGVLFDKHIPEVYLRASAEQRMELLKGLMDTDGSIIVRKSRNPKRVGYAPLGQVHINCSKEDLAYQIYELVSSLGIKATVKKSKNKAWYTDSEGSKKETKHYWMIRFTTKKPVFHLKRKTQKQNLDADHRQERSIWRTIVNVEPVPDTLMKCIGVDSPSHLYLVTDSFIPTHNSNMDVRLAAGRMDSTPSAMVLDSGEAVNLPGIKGRGLIRVGGNLTVFQGYFAPQDWIDDFILKNPHVEPSCIAPGGHLHDKYQAMKRLEAKAAEEKESAGSEEAPAMEEKSAKKGKPSLKALTKGKKGKESEEAAAAPVVVEQPEVPEVTPPPLEQTPEGIDLTFEDYEADPVTENKQALLESLNRREEDRLEGTETNEVPDFFTGSAKRDDSAIQKAVEPDLDLDDDDFILDDFDDDMDGEDDSTPSPVVPDITKPAAEPAAKIKHEWVTASPFGDDEPEEPELLFEEPAAPETRKPTIPSRPVKPSVQSPPAAANPAGSPTIQRPQRPASPFSPRS